MGMQESVKTPNDQFLDAISHLRKDGKGIAVTCQSNESHSRGVAELAKKFAGELGMGDWGYVMGLLHDKGKEKHSFQEYIQDVNGIPGHKHYTWKGKAHAYVGALMAKQLFPKEYPLMGNPIMGHHRGLYDYTDLEEEEKQPMPSEVLMPHWDNIALPLPGWFHPSVLQPKDFHHIERMLYSCLVDADYLDTEHFMLPHQSELRKGRKALDELLPKLNAYLTGFGMPTTEVNKIRHEVQQACIKESEGNPGFYSLTVPTGGGKTLSSLVWALRHAVKNKKKRIIIAIPYTSIIVQTAAVLRRIFGDENVLEHHSQVAVDDSKQEQVVQQLKLATENWDYPIIITTNVQLLESMFANRPSDCRKLHSICNSVLIMDEVQTLPIGFLQPIVDTLDTYQRLFGLSVLFTTASQPVLSGKHQGTHPFIHFTGLPSVKEIIPPAAHLHDRMRRVDLHMDDTPCSYDEIAERLRQFARVLCIVNTRRDAKELSERLPDEGVRIHLSRMMCPAHLSASIQEMKRLLALPDSTPVRVVSTQLIEAGVDIDFPVVFRQEAGLDAILQAAGRCNREGKHGICTTYVFSLAKEHALPKGHISQCNAARKNMTGNYDWFSPRAMNDYFIQLYARVQDFDKQDMKHYLYNPKELMLETAATKFRLIDDETVPVIVNWKDSLTLVERLKQNGPSYELVRQLSQFSVDLRRHDFDRMLKEGIVEEVVDGFYAALGKSQYSAYLGLLTDNQWLEETWIV